MNVFQTYRIALTTIVIKEITRFTRIWLQTLVPPAITMTLYFVIFGALIGKRVGNMAGFGYMEYIAPGLIMMSVITNSYSNVVSSFFSAKFQRHIEELMVAPVPNGIVLLGYVIGGVCRAMLTGFIVSGIALFFIDIPIAHLWVVIVLALLTAITFSLGGFINAIFAKKFDDISIVPTFVLTPLTYLGGVFYSIKLLPEFWQTVSLFNPILYMVNGFRYGFLGQSDVPVWTSIGISLAFIAVLASWALWLLHKGIGLRQ